MHVRGRSFRLLLTAVITVATAGVWLSATAGAAGAESITAEHVDITIRADGDLAVAERITYDFGPVPHHGIIREIPTRVHYDSKYDRRYPIAGVTVSASAGTPAPSHTSSSGGWTSIKVGDANRTITGVHTYVVSYVVHGAMTAFRDHDELYWNALGSRWSVVRNNASVAVHAPAGITKVACYAGPTGSHDPCQFARSANRTATFRQGAVFPDEDLTVVVALPRGTISPVPRPILVERWSLDRAFSRTPAALAVSIGALVALLIGSAVVMWNVGRDRRFVGSAVDVAFGSTDGAEERVGPFEHGDSPVEFTPPDNLRPGEIGTLIDEQANPLDVTATIVDLAVRGYLTIEEVPKHGWFGHADWKLTAQKEGDGLLPYEKALLSALFAKHQEVNLSALRRTFATSLHRVEEKLYQDVTKHGWFYGRPDKVRARWKNIGQVVTVAGVAVTFLLAKYTHWGLAGIPLFLAGLVLMAGAHNMPRRTAKGTGTLRRVRGFREFIDQSEKERARFAEQQNLFSEYLPYAIVFGCVHKWAKAFEGLADEPANNLGWYQSSQPFSTLGFANAIDSFAVTTSGTISAAAPSSSGGSSGFSGGSSGGGGGGGGGGSW